MGGGSLTTAVRAHDLINLARSRETGDRERLLMAVTDLCDGSPDSRRPEIQSLGTSSPFRNRRVCVPLPDSGLKNAVSSGKSAEQRREIW